MKFPLPDHYLVPGCLYKFWLCFSLDGTTALVEQTRSIVELYPNPEVAIPVAHVAIGSWVIYIEHKPFSFCDDGDTMNYMMVKVICGDMIGWIACFYKGAFYPESYFTTSHEPEE